MNVRRIGAMVLVALWAFGGACSAASDSPASQAFLGVSIDSQPLPDLLIKHLQLSPGQGLRIENVARNSPADAAGLERDDIIIRFQNRDANDYEAFVNTVRQAGVGTEVSLEVIHLGQHKTIQVTLAKWTSEPEWKYPPEPSIVESWQPGKMFMLKPGQRDWTEIPFDKLPNIGELPQIRKFFRDQYVFDGVGPGGKYSVTIEGDPNADDTWVTVKTKDTEYRATVKNLSDLPKEQQEAAQKALADARKAKEQRSNVEVFRYGPPQLDRMKRYFENIPNQIPDTWQKRTDEVLQKIEKQMQQVRDRLQGLEEEQKQLLDRLPDRAGKPQQNQPSQKDSEGGPSI